MYNECIYSLMYHSQYRIFSKEMEVDTAIFDYDRNHAYGYEKFVDV